MKPIPKPLSLGVKWIGVLFLFVSVGCSTQIIANYDENTLKSIMEVSKKIDLFFADVHRVPKAMREYRFFKNHYFDIEVELNALRFRTSLKPMNELSTKQVDKAIELWQMEAERHRKKNSFPDFLIKRHRQQFMKVFIAMAKGEEAKPKSKQ